MRMRTGPNFQIQRILYDKQQIPDCAVRIAVKRALSCIKISKFQIQHKVTSFMAIASPAPTIVTCPTYPWLQYVQKLMMRLVSFLQLPDYPAPARLYDGMYFTSLYMTLKDRGTQCMHPNNFFC